MGYVGRFPISWNLYGNEDLVTLMIYCESYE